ncbi:MAG TPA: DUF5985 family protein [Steroidobacteraceae bacterium]|nr:DUF5985 family protein [Steroidobacteraceae bacterium]
MAEAVYALCAVTSVLCMILLLRGYLETRTRLLFWASLCFAGFAVNNVLLFIDLVLLPNTDLFWWRTVPALVGVSLFIYGLIWEAE